MKGTEAFRWSDKSMAANVTLLSMMHLHLAALWTISMSLDLRTLGIQAVDATSISNQLLQTTSVNHVKGTKCSAKAFP